MGEFVAGERCSWELSRACFAAGTMLLTPNGAVAIEALRVGDVVMSRSEYDASGPVEAKVIEEVFVRTGQLLWLTVGDERIGTTSEHPFWIVGNQKAKYFPFCNGTYDHDIFHWT